MSELLDKQVNVQKESLKKTSGIHANSRKPTKKVCDKNESRRRRIRKKNDGCFKKIFVKGFYKAVSEDLAEPISTNFRLLILQTMKVLILE